MPGNGGGHPPAAPTLFDDDHYDIPGAIDRNYPGEPGGVVPILADSLISNPFTFLPHLGRSRLAAHPESVCAHVGERRCCGAGRDHPAHIGEQ